MPKRELLEGNPAPPREAGWKSGASLLFHETPNLEEILSANSRGATGAKRLCAANPLTVLTQWPFETTAQLRVFMCCRLAQLAEQQRSILQVMGLVHMSLAAAQFNCQNNGSHQPLN